MPREWRGFGWSSAMGYPWLYRSRDDKDATAATIAAGLYGNDDDDDWPEFAEDALYDYALSPEWESWVDANVPEDLLVQAEISTRSSTKFKPPRRPHGKLTYIAPVSEFTAGEAPRDTFRRLHREIWVAAALRYGWPEPPPLPPYHDPSLIEDDDDEDDED
jgi:hypothetical protein